MDKECTNFKDLIRIKRERLHTPRPAHPQNLRLIEFIEETKNQNIDELAKSNDTPSFNKSLSEKDINLYCRKFIQVNYDSPDRYIFEFFHSPSYDKYVKVYLKAIKRKNSKKIKIQKQIKFDRNTEEVLSVYTKEKNKVLFLEIDGTLILCSNTKIPNCPILCYVPKHKAMMFGMDEFYVHIRPFTLCFLNTIAEKYFIIFYSTLEQELLTYILKTIQQEKIFSPISISSFNEKGAKNISKFWGNSISPDRSVIVDCDPKVCSLNAQNCVPVHKFNGASKDATLLYLEKYLLKLADCENVKDIIQKDIITNGFERHKNHYEHI